MKKGEGSGKTSAQQLHMTSSNCKASANSVLPNLPNMAILPAINNRPNRMSANLQSQYLTPFEQGNQNQTTTWDACVAFYEKLAADFPNVLQFAQIGTSDAGVPIHAGIVSVDGVFACAELKRMARPIFFNNNGIHPGEPEGIDVCMAQVRDFCVQPERLAELGQTVYLFIPIYNVDGCLNRQNTSRVNQDGPEQFGFRANSRNLDLNRDFIKCDSLSAQVFNRFFSTWDPDVMVDTHTSNGADYSYTMTLIQTQADKLGGALGAFLRESMLPAIFQEMTARGWPTCPYVNPVKVTPEDGIEDFLETPRFSTGYAALHHTIGFMPETHMLKPYADRCASMRALVQTVLAFTVANAAAIQTLRAQAKRDAAKKSLWPVCWQADYSRHSKFYFEGFKAVQRPSKIGNYQRLAYDRTQPWQGEIAYYNYFNTAVEIKTPKAYLIPQAWREVIERLLWNQVKLQRLDADQVFSVQSYRILAVQSRAHAYEGRMFHDAVEQQAHVEDIHARAGDFLLNLQQPNARYAVETLEPQAHDSFFRWGFFNSVLEKKEHFSDYIFEDSALEMLQEDAELNAKFEQWKRQHPEQLADQNAVLEFIFTHGLRHREPEWRRYPVYSVFDDTL